MTEKIVTVGPGPIGAEPLFRAENIECVCRDGVATLPGMPSQPLPQTDRSGDSRQDRRYHRRRQ